MTFDAPAVPSRRSVLLATMGVLAVPAVGGSGPSGATPQQSDALTSKTLRVQQIFTGWLASQRVSGCFGEVGWPATDAGRWNLLATQWFDAAAAARVPSFVWAAAQRWPPAYPLAVYRRAGPEVADGSLDTAGPQAVVLEGRSSNGALRGINLADGSFSSSQSNNGTYSAAEPGTYGQDYVYPSSGSVAWLADRGLRAARLAVTWERLQPVLGGELDATEVGRVSAVVEAAQVSGIDVVLDLHNFGRYVRVSGGVREVLRLGDSGLDSVQLADLWRRLAHVFVNRAAVAGYGLMNEPHDLPGGATGWEVASQVAVNAVREVDRTTPVYVGGYDYSSALRWADNHPRAWVRPGWTSRLRSPSVLRLRRQRHLHEALRGRARHRPGSGERLRVVSYLESWSPPSAEVDRVSSRSRSSATTTTFTLCAPVQGYLLRGGLDGRDDGAPQPPWFNLGSTPCRDTRSGRPLLRSGRSMG